MRMVGPGPRRDVAAGAPARFTAANRYAPAKTWASCAPRGQNHPVPVADSADIGRDWPAGSARQYRLYRRAMETLSAGEPPETTSPSTLTS